MLLYILSKNMFICAIFCLVDVELWENLRITITNKEYSTKYYKNHQPNKSPSKKNVYCLCCFIFAVRKRFAVNVSRDYFITQVLEIATKIDINLVIRAEISS